MNSAPNPTPAHGTRRHVLGWSLAGLATTLAGYCGWRLSGRSLEAPAQPVATVPPVSPPAEVQAPVTAPASLSREAFAKQLQTTFRTDHPLVQLKLINVSETQTFEGKGVKFASFSLLFSLSGSRSAESTTYHLEHDALGAMDLFLSPVGNGKKGTLMEACFTQRV